MDTKICHWQSLPNFIEHNELITGGNLNHLPQLRCVLLLNEEEKYSYFNSNSGKQNKFCEAKFSYADFQFPSFLRRGEPRLQRWGGVNIVFESKSVIGNVVKPEVGRQSVFRFFIFIGQ